MNDILGGYLKTELTRDQYALSLGMTSGQLKALLKKHSEIKKPKIVMPPRKANAEVQKEILADYHTNNMSIPDLIQKYHISKATIYRIVNKTTQRRTIPQ